MAIQDNGKSNVIEVGSNIQLTGVISGDNNKIIINNAEKASSVRLNLNGDGNLVYIESPIYLHDLAIKVGNHVKAHNTHLHIGRSLSIENGGVFYLYNSGNICKIGCNCLFSNGLVIRCGESPHLLFDKHSGEYLDVSEGVIIGDHVWIGEKVYITKRASIPNESVVAACSVVTKRFGDSNSVLAGNPAKVVRKNIQWIRNYSHLESGDIYDESYKNFNKQYPLF